MAGSSKAGASSAISLGDSSVRDWSETAAEGTGARGTRRGEYGVLAPSLPSCCEETAPRSSATRAGLTTAAPWPDSWLISSRLKGAAVVGLATTGPVGAVVSCRARCESSLTCVADSRTCCRRSARVIRRPVVGEAVSSGASPILYRELPTSSADSWVRRAELGGLASVGS